MFGIRDVEVLREIVRRDGFRPAALALGVSQSAVSGRVAALERTLGVALFDRSRRKAELTPEGRRFLEDAERLVMLRDRIAARYGAGEGGSTLRLGVAETIVHTGMGALMRRLHDGAPGLRIELAVESSPALAAMLADGALDLAVLMTPFVPPGATARPHGRFELGWYAAADAAVAPEPLDAAALAAHPIVTFARGTLPYAEVERRLAGTGDADAPMDPPLLHGSASLATVMTMVADGLGVGTLPRAVAGAAVRAGRIREVRVADHLALAALDFSLAWIGAPPAAMTDLSNDPFDHDTIA